MLPSKSEYQRVLQNPHIFLQDPKLKLLKVERDQFDLPWVRSGGFALTYKLQNSHQTYALRCFHKPVSDREKRYAAISKYLLQNPSKIFVGVEYQPSGILVNGNIFPITIMEWVNGYTLGTYIDKNINNINNIKTLSNSFKILVNELERLQIAHGDLSSKNIIIRDGRMILVDYDGMYVPALHGCLNNELGNPSFQHPGRNETHFGPYLDHFSEIVIYLALEALSESPSLYQRYGMGTEGLLFSRNDFKNCSTSALLQEIRRIKKLEFLVAKFERICVGDILVVPTLNSFINEPILGVSVPEAIEYQNINLSGYKTLNAANLNTLIDNIDELVTVIGKIDEVKNGYTYDYQPYVFLNVGYFPKQTFTVVIWSEILTLLKKSGRAPSNFVNNWISITGVMDVYNDKLQIVLDSPTDIAVITEDQALQRLGQNINKEVFIKDDKYQLSEDHNVSPNVSKELDNTVPNEKSDSIQSSSSVPPTFAPLGNKGAANTPKSSSSVTPTPLRGSLPTPDISKRLNDLYKSNNPVQKTTTHFSTNVQTSQTKVQTSTSKTKGNSAKIIIICLLFLSGFIMFTFLQKSVEKEVETTNNTNNFAVSLSTRTITTTNKTPTLKPSLTTTSLTSNMSTDSDDIWRIEPLLGSVLIASNNTSSFEWNEIVAAQARYLAIAEPYSWEIYELPDDAKIETVKEHYVMNLTTTQFHIGVDATDADGNYLLTLSAWDPTYKKIALHYLNQKTGQSKNHIIVFYSGFN